MEILIRVDASRLIGTGHVMRCLVLAELLKQKKNRVSFLCRDLPGQCSSLIKNKHYECHLLPLQEAIQHNYRTQEPTDDYSIWLGVTQQQDAQETIEYLRQNPADLLIVDHYGLDHNWHTQIKSHIRKLMVIDDLANRQHVCDFLLDHNYYDNFSIRYDHLVPKNCIRFLGPQYALLNSELYKIRKRRVLRSTDENNSLKTILVFLGGMDIKNHTNVVLQQLLESKYANCKVDVVLGKANPFKDNLIAAYKQHKNIQFHIQPTYYFQLMYDADFSINAGGVSALERLFIGLPFIAVCTAENQRQICMDFKKGKLAEYVEDASILSSALDNFNPKDFNLFYPELKHSELINSISLN